MQMMCQCSCNRGSCWIFSAHKIYRKPQLVDDHK